jgi:hypothetical protein
MYLEDSEVLDLLEKAKKSLYNGYRYGIMICKENEKTAEDTIVDPVQHAYTRTREQLLNLFAKAKYKVCRMSKNQITFGLWTAGSHMYCIQPMDADADD